jgi:hypothetical protein
MAYTWRSSRRRPREVGQGIGSAGPGSARLVAARRARAGHGMDQKGESAHSRVRVTGARARNGKAALVGAGQGVSRHGSQQLNWHIRKGLKWTG